MEKQKLIDVDSVINYLVSEGGVKLTKPQQKKLARWCSCDDLIRLYKKRSKVVNALVNKYEVSKQTALKDYYACQQVFGTTNTHSKDYHLDLWLEEYADAFLVAKAKNDAATMARLLSAKSAFLKDHFGDKHTIDYSQLHIPQQIVVADPSLLENKQLPEAELMNHVIRLKQVEKVKQKLSEVSFEHVEEAAVIMA